ncbi:hypothetical protein SBY92_000346 [Candida maltosa Xu316]|uniref:Uncharacterized protein n=1 Tax=Candida maltosa (strain Xu316) TaxID=1245528 RepID=M3HDY0_CANMX|nr:hypothetical protein G210_4363 [Candida maltosa Xu316]
MGHNASKNKSTSKNQSTKHKSGSTKSHSHSHSHSKTTSVPKSPAQALTPKPKPKQQLATESRPVGTRDDNDTAMKAPQNGQLSAKEASARAAEERYQKLQSKNAGLNDRLKAKAKQGRNDKGL